MVRRGGWPPPGLHLDSPGAGTVMLVESHPGEILGSGAAFCRMLRRRAKEGKEGRVILVAPGLHRHTILENWGETCMEVSI